MLFDHIGKVFFQDLLFLQYVGRLAFPIFAFQIVQGYKHTKDIKAYIKRLLIFGLVSQIPYVLFLSTYSGGDIYRLNIIFTLLLGLVGVYAFDKLKNKMVGGLIVLAICLLAELFKVDYGAYGIAVIMLFYGFERIKNRGWIAYGGCFGIFLVLSILRYLDFVVAMPRGWLVYLNSVLWASGAVILIYMFNGKRGIRARYLFYLFYPVHLLVIYLMSITM